MLEHGGGIDGEGCASSRLWVELMFFIHPEVQYILAHGFPELL